MIKLDGYKWINITEVKLNELKNALTKDNPLYTKALSMGVGVKDLEPILKYYLVKNDVIRVPRNFNLDKFIIKEKVDIQDNTVLGNPVDIKSKIILRPEQEEPVKILGKIDNTIVSMPCGAGKTIVALEAIARKSITTLVLVHKKFLMNQWAERIKEFLDIDVGYIGAGKEDWKGKKIVIGMIQSLINYEKYAKEMFEYFGVIVTDEAHLLGSVVWSKVIGEFPAKVRWGLTATPTRADGMEFVFKWGIGKVGYLEQEQDIVPRVYQVKTNLFIAPISYKNNWNYKTNMSKLITKVSEDVERNKSILELIKSAEKEGRKLLVLGDRVVQLKDFYKQLKKGHSVGLYLGETSLEDRKKTEEKDIILATSQMASEGLDIPKLDTLFLVSPKGGKQWLQQAIGRIQRKVDGKKLPIVIDFVDRKIPILVNLALKREEYYKIKKFNLGE